MLAKPKPLLQRGQIDILKVVQQTVQDSVCRLAQACLICGK